MDSKAISRAVWIVPAALLAIATADWPYGYYQFVRLAVCGACLFLAYTEFQSRRIVTLWLVALVVVAIVFNPLLPLHLTKDIWRWLDGAAAVTLIAHMLFVHDFKR